jgi:hypothetical protein
MGPWMILPDLVLPSRVHQHWQYSGIDSLERCRDKKHFVNYPHSVDYVYNSRGFRDREWPDSLDELRNAVWCIGDSFTVGIGQPLAHIWPQVLSATLDCRTINVSMDGASNDWIYRRAIDIQRCVNPVQMIVMWSYTHRRESDRVDLDDEQRRRSESKDSDLEDFSHWTRLSGNLYNENSKIIQITIPDFHVDQNTQKNLWNAICDKDWPSCPQSISDLKKLPLFILEEMNNVHHCYTQFKNLLSHLELQKKSIDLPLDVLHISQRLDWARDYHHFDILTAQWVVDQIRPRIVV